MNFNRRESFSFVLHIHLAEDELSRVVTLPELKKAS